MSNLKELTRAFFGFSVKTTVIHVILPALERARSSTLNCANYPLYDFDVAPDDVFSGVRVHALLTASYPKAKVEIGFTKDTVGRALEENSVLIGGPPTNDISKAVLSELAIGFSGYVKDSPDRHIVFEGKKYRIGFTSGARKQIRTDYCLLSKCHQDGRRLVVISGLRAYGQKAAYDFLNDLRFYDQIREILDQPEFQILVEVDVENQTITRWRVVESVLGPMAFISYYSERLIVYT